jgi:hypothetical protein
MRLFRFFLAFIVIAIVFGLIAIAKETSVCLLTVVSFS